MTYKQLYEYQKEITIKQREVVNIQKATIKRLHWLVERKAKAYSVVAQKHQDELKLANAEIEKWQGGYMTQKQEIANLEVELKSMRDAANSYKSEIKNYQNYIEHLNFTYDIKGVRVDAIQEFAERLCEDRVSNDPVVIAVKTELKMMQRNGG